MKLESQVCSLELAKRLKELGVKQESLFYWKDIVGTKEGCFYKEVSMYKDYHIGGVDFELLCSAFTVAELGNLIGAGLNTKINMSGNIVVFHTLHEGGFTADTEADARAKMLIYLLENNLLTPASQDKE